MEEFESTVRLRAAMVSIARDRDEVEECNRSLDELERLLDTAGGEAVIRMLQIKATYDPRTCIGGGKVKELRELCENQDVKLVVFDFELSPSQIRNLENDLGGIDVLDRTMLILDIFAKHATTGEGKLQVELAQLRYTSPRLTGHGLEYSRLGGTIGTRGPGETQLETDRRHLKRRVDALEAQLREMEANRNTMRAARDRSGIPQVAIVGYTNAGKSTLLNYLTDAGVLSRDQLFATLDPTTRRLEIDDRQTVLLTDTVGFIRKLPHHLIQAFHSTLEEAARADVLLVLSDATDPEGDAHLAVTEKLLSELGAGDKPVLYVLNKCDRLDSFPSFDEKHPDTVYISAKTGEGIPHLFDMLVRILQEGKQRVTLHIPYAEQGKMNLAYHYGTVEDVAYGEDGIIMTAVLDARGRGALQEYVSAPSDDDEE